jgi:hypothetical protein
MRDIHSIHVAKERIAQRNIEITRAPVIDTLEGGNTGYPIFSTQGDWVTDCAQVERMDGVFFSARE